jgi:endonuclease-3 related protein
MGTPRRRISVSAPTLKAVYQKLFLRFGPQRWWPAQTPFEVMIGAILVQNTNWANVEKAIRNLKKAKLLSPKKLQEISHRRLSLVIKPAGYFNIKAKRLKNFINFLFKEYRGRIAQMAEEEGGVLRVKLLTVNGIGPETADSILLYGLNKPFFVIDAYTKRIFLRHRWIKGDADYRTVQKLFMDRLKPERRMFNEYHALLVCLAKTFCKTKPLCRQCPLETFKLNPN